MGEKKLYQKKLENENFRYDEEASLVEVNSSDIEKIRSKLKPKKSFRLKDNTGIEYQANDVREVMQMLDDYDISEVYIEEVSLDGARVAKYKIDNPHAEKARKLDLVRGGQTISPQRKKEVNVLEAERFLNQEHKKNTTYHANNVPSNMVNEFGDELDSDLLQSTHPEDNTYINFTIPDQLMSQIDQNEPNDIEENQHSKEIQSKNSNSITTEDVLFTKKKLTKKSSFVYKNFFKIKNNSELFRIGKSFLADYKDGHKCFGFTSDGDIMSMVSTLYGIAAFFNFYSHTRVLVLVDDEELYKMKSMMDFKRSTVFDEHLDFEYDIWESEGISLMSYSMFNLDNKNKAFDVMDKFVGLSGVTFCSIPQRKSFEDNIDLYFQILQRVDLFSLIIKKGVTRLSDIQKMISNFRNYNVKIKGAIVGKK